MDIGNAVRYLRKQRGWTQAELAEFAFTSKPNISNLENGNHGYSSTLLKHLGAAFDCKVSYIFALAEQLEAEQMDEPDVQNFSIEVMFIRLPTTVQNQMKSLIFELLKTYVR